MASASSGTQLGDAAFLGGEAGDAVAETVDDEGGLLDPAARFGERAARREGAAAAELVRSGHKAWDLGEARGAGAERGHRCHQRARVGMARPVEQVEHRRFLDLLAGVHHDHPVAALGDDAEVVGDHDHAHAELALQALDQVEDLRLDGDVEGGGRLVGDQQLGLARQRQGDHHALAHAAGELMRILDGATLGLGDLHQLQHLDHAPHRRGAAEALVQLHALGDLPADAQHRVERGHRLLEDHRDAVAADPAHLLLAERRADRGRDSARRRRGDRAAPAPGAGSRAR